MFRGLVDRRKNKIMSPFWAGLFENLQGRGRNATLFLVTLPVLLVTVLIAARIPESTYRNTILPALPWVGLVAAAWSVRSFLRARARSRERLARSALSNDERCKARAKLVRQERGHACPLRGAGDAMKADTNVRAPWRQNSLVPPA